MQLPLTDEEKWAYKRFIDEGHYQASLVESNYDKGLVEGRAEGEQIGIEKGKAEGEQVGLEKGKLVRELEIAKNMKSAGMAIELIQQITGLSEEEIKRIKS